jgi:hypothetical protein
MKTILIIQGPLYTICLENIIKMCNSFPCIISTWDNEDQTKIEMLKPHVVDILLNKIPEYNGIQNVNYANYSTVSGLYTAQNLGYTHALTFRTDLYCPNIKELISIFENESVDKLVAFAWMKHIVPPHAPDGYIMDKIYFGPIDKCILHRSSIQNKNDNRFAEAFLQDSYFKKSPVTYEDVKNTFCFVLDKLIKANICIYYTGKTPSGNQELVQAYNSIIDMFIC